jgi:excisionase family DNA binding protein
VLEQLKLLRFEVFTLYKIIDSQTIAQAVTKAVLEALNGLEQPQAQVKQPKAETATLSPEEFRQALGTRGYGINRIRELLREGRIKHVKSGSKNFRIPRSELVGFIEREAQGGK